jgi:anthranilate/para-aminobenzoate synthase component I
VMDGQLSTNPLAGTRPRGATPAEDARLRQELQADRKELAEHVLSVTTMFAELEPLCVPDSLVVRRLLDVVLQPRVQHLSSVIAGKLAPDYHVLDALWALFPSVTVTGLPKPAALALLRSIEPAPRGLYAGAIGWAAGPRSGRFSLAIRGIYRYGGRTVLQAGAGIMPESQPDAERAEVAAKLRAMEEALARSRSGPGCRSVGIVSE